MLFEIRKERETKLVINPSTSVMFPSFNLRFLSGILITILTIPNDSIW
jgi:hypothetical protein